MPNLEYKKNCVCEPTLNLARNLLLKDDGSIYPRTGDFRPMVSSAVWVKRLRRENGNTKLERLFTLLKVIEGYLIWSRQKNKRLYVHFL